MEVIRLKGDYIKLGQALKAAGAVGSGTDAKAVIGEGLVKVDGKVEYQRGKKLTGGEEIEYDGTIIRIEA